MTTPCATISTRRGTWIPAISLALLALMTTGAARGGPDARILYQEGLAAVAKEDWEAALDKLEAAVAAEPNNLRYGTEYRQAVIKIAGTESTEPYQREIDFFKKLVEEHPDAPNAFLNLAFAHVDKIPAEGAITQVILANSSLGYFAKALELEETWLGYYSRGHAYLFWPTIFGRAPKGIGDLEKAIEISKKDAKKKPYYSRAWAALGDGYWRLDDVDKAREIWRQGLAAYPDDAELEARLARTDRAELDAYLEAHYETGHRVDTHLREIFENE